MTRSVKIDLASMQIAIVYKFLNYLTHAEIHGESSKAYRMRLSPLEQKILINIQLGVICVDMHD